MRTEDDKKDTQEQQSHQQDKDRSDSPGEMVIDEEKHDDFSQSSSQQNQQQPQPQQPTGPPGFSYQYVSAPKDSTNDNAMRNTEPKPLLSAQYEPLSDED